MKITQDMVNITGTYSRELGTIDHKQLRTLLRNIKYQSNFHSPDVLVGEVSDKPLTVYASFTYTWDGDDKKTLPSKRELQSLRISSRSE